jgi:dynein heavy chain
MEKNSEEWSAWCVSESQEHTTLPGDWGRMPAFKQLLLLRAMRPDRVAATLQHFCEAVMGARYVNQEAFSPQAVLAESSRCVLCWVTAVVGTCRQACAAC